MNDRRKWWLDEPRNRDKVFYALCVLCTVLFAADFFYDKKGYFGFEAWPGFYAGYGFIAIIALVLLAKLLRRLVKRDEDYYER